MGQGQGHLLGHGQWLELQCGARSLRGGGQSPQDPGGLGCAFPGEARPVRSLSGSLSNLLSERWGERPRAAGRARWAKECFSQAAVPRPPLVLESPRPKPLL